MTFDGTRIVLAGAEQSRKIAELEILSFAGKIEVMIGGDPRSIIPLYEQYLRQVLVKKASSIILLEKDRETAGILIVKGKRLPDHNIFPGLAFMMIVFRKLGLRKIIRTLIGFVILSDQAFDKTLLLVETLAVESEHRGKGYGRFLLSVADRLARQRGFRGLALWVVTTNSRALELYLKNGYKTEKIYQSGVFRIFTGVDGFVYMVKRF